MGNETCPFCAIAAGLRPANIVHESPQYLCFVPLKVEAPGHLVIATRVHYTSLLDAPAQLGAELIEVCQYLARHSPFSDGSVPFNLLSANGAEAQQSVMHLHLHFIPRRAGDRINAWPNLEPT